ncbi:MAG: aminopeptidase P family protein, partial [Clostridiaceae bacterium]|nr:aminopeptidase P family protein [Clostridiaceae bacterium]
MVPLQELQVRMANFRNKMDSTEPEWKIVVIFKKINIYYFTGTMQEGMLIIPRDGEATYWVRRSFERALDESAFKNIKPMNSYRDAAGSYKKLPETVYLETEVVPFAMYERFHKHFPFENTKSCDAQLSAVRSVKSPYELSLMEQSGEIHRKVLEEEVPGLLKEGMSELELIVKVFERLIDKGHHGVSRFGMFDTEMGVGQIGFGESSIYPTYFNGPGGNYGMSPAVPFWGSRERKLKKGDLVFIDVLYP